MTTRPPRREEPARRKRPGRWLERLLLLVGIVAIDVWIWSLVVTDASQRYQNWVFDQTLHGQGASVLDYVSQALDRVFGQPKPQPPRVAKNAAPKSPAPPRLENNGLIGRLTIPRLHLSAIVREGAGEETLSMSLGHIPSTALPGQQGNVGVAGHRDTLFRDLRNVRKNDLILLETLTGSYSYEVEATRIVKPRDISVLNASAQPELTLVTCYPFYYVGSAPDRFIVRARQVARKPDASHSS